MTGAIRFVDLPADVYVTDGGRLSFPWPPVKIGLAERRKQERMVAKAKKKPKKC